MSDTAKPETVVLATTWAEVEAAIAAGVDVIVLGPEVEIPEGRVVLSASQVDTFLTQCRAKWAFDKIGRVPRLESESASLGTEVHAQLEGYLSGRPLDFTHEKGAGYIAAAGVHLIPDPHLEGRTDEEIEYLAREVGIETEFRFVSGRTGFVYLGRKDLEMPDSGLIPGLAEEHALPVDEQGRTGVPAVLDHKSTGAMRYAKTPEVLTWDVQGVLYAYALVVARRARQVDLAWVYYQTKGARSAKRVHLRVHADHATRAFRAIESVAVEMAAFHRASKSHEDRVAFVRANVPKNPNACRAYGGCPYEAVCQLTLQERMRASMSGTDFDFLSTLQARATADDAGKPAPAPAPAAPSVMGCAPEDVPAPAGLPSWLLAPLTPSVSTRDVPPSVTVPPPSPAPSEPPVAINPPDEVTAAPSFLPPPPAPAAPPTDNLDPPAPSSDETSQGTLTPATVEASADKPKRGPGRPKGSRNKPKPDPLGADVHLHTADLDSGAAAAIAACEEPTNLIPTAEQAAAGPALFRSNLEEVIEGAVASGYIAPGVIATKVGAQVVKVDEDALKREDFDLDGFTLYVNCFPVGRAYTTLEDILPKAKAAIREATKSAKHPDGLADYRFAEYGQGPGLLTGAVLAEVLKDPPSHLVVSTHTPEGAICFADLMSKAAFVVRGLS